MAVPATAPLSMPLFQGVGANPAGSLGDGIHALQNFAGGVSHAISGIGRKLAENFGDDRAQNHSDSVEGTDVTQDKYEIPPLSESYLEVFRTEEERDRSPKNGKLKYVLRGSHDKRSVLESNLDVARAVLDKWVGMPEHKAEFDRLAAEFKQMLKQRVALDQEDLDKLVADSKVPGKTTVNAMAAAVDKLQWDVELHDNFLRQLDQPPESAYAEHPKKDVMYYDKQTRRFHKRETARFHYPLFLHYPQRVPPPGPVWEGLGPMEARFRELQIELNGYINSGRGPHATDVIDAFGEYERYLARILRKRYLAHAYEGLDTPAGQKAKNEYINFLSNRMVPSEMLKYLEISGR